MKLRLAVDLDPEVLAVDVQSFLAAVRFVLRGIFPMAKLRVTVDETPIGHTCTPATHVSTTPPQI